MMKKTFNDLNLIRQQNQAKVFSLLKKGNLSCSQLAKMLSLSNVALYNIMDDFLSNNIVKIVDSPPAGPGRKPWVYALDRDFGLFAAVDFSTMDISIGIYDITGKKLAEDFERKATLVDKNCIERVVDRLRVLVKHSDFKNLPLRSVGICTPGRIDNKTGFFWAAARFKDCTSINLERIFTEAFHCYVSVKNDMHLSLMGAVTHPLLKELKSALFLHIGSSIGSALLIDGKLREGDTGAAGEFGSTLDFNQKPIAPNITLVGMFNDYRHKLIDSEHLDFLETEHKRSNAKNIDEFAQLFRQGDSFAEQSVIRSADILAVALNNIIAVLDCPTVILSGEIECLGEKFLNLLQERTDKHYFYHPPVYMYSPLGKTPQLTGCLNLALDTCILRTLKSKSEPSSES